MAKYIAPLLFLLLAGILLFRSVTPKTYAASNDAYLPAVFNLNSPASKPTPVVNPTINPTPGLQPTPVSEPTIVAMPPEDCTTSGGITFCHNLWSTTPPSNGKSPSDYVGDPQLVDPNHVRAPGDAVEDWYKVNPNSPIYGQGFGPNQ